MPEVLEEDSWETSRAWCFLHDHTKNNIFLFIVHAANQVGVMILLHNRRNELQKQICFFLIYLIPYTNQWLVEGDHLISNLQCLHRTCPSPLIQLWLQCRRVGMWKYLVLESPSLSHNAHGFWRHSFSSLARVLWYSARRVLSSNWSFSEKRLVCIWSSSLPNCSFRFFFFSENVSRDLLITDFQFIFLSIFAAWPIKDPGNSAFQPFRIQSSRLAWLSHIGVLLGKSP